jgi:hypothetical protein
MLRVLFIKPAIIWHGMHGNSVEDELNKCGLRSEIECLLGQRIPMGSGLTFIANIARKIGPDAPIKILDEKECYAPIRSYLLPGCEKVSDAVLSATHKIEFLAHPIELLTRRIIWSSEDI